MRSMLYIRWLVFHDHFMIGYCFRLRGCAMTIKISTNAYCAHVSHITNSTLLSFCFLGKIESVIIRHFNSWRCGFPAHTAHNKFWAYMLKWVKLHTKRDVVVVVSFRENFKVKCTEHHERSFSTPTTRLKPRFVLVLPSWRLGCIAYVDELCDRYLKRNAMTRSSSSVTTALPGYIASKNNKDNGKYLHFKQRQSFTYLGR